MTPQKSNTFDDHDDDDGDSCILHLWQRHDSNEACKFIMKAEQNYNQIIFVQLYEMGFQKPIFYYSSSYV